MTSALLAAEDWQLEESWKTNSIRPAGTTATVDGFYRAMFDVLPLEKCASWPVYVSLAEARAYASWRGKRLPTEAEFHRAAYYGPDERETAYPWGDARARTSVTATSILPLGRRCPSVPPCRSESLGSSRTRR